jgi:hypothetical protein
MAGLADALTAAEARAGDANVAKQRGLYVDLLANGTLSLPSGVSEGEAEAAVAQAREVGASAALLHDPDALAAFASPPLEAVALAAEVFGALLDAGIDDAEAAAGLLRGLSGRLAPPEEQPPA